MELAAMAPVALEAPAAQVATAAVLKVASALPLEEELPESVVALTLIGGDLVALAAMADLVVLAPVVLE